MGFLLPIIELLAIIFAIVIVHELGHFIAAKKSGVKVEEFGFGFPPRLFGIRKGETLYSINAILFGGFVKLYGEDGSHSEDKRSFGHTSPSKKIIILLAGIFLNIVLGWLILFSGYLVGMKPIIPGLQEHPGVVSTLRVEVTGVEGGSPAEKEGLKSGDIIRKIDGNTIGTSEDVIFYINQKIKNEKTNNITVKMAFERDGVTQEKNIGTYIVKEQIGKRTIESPKMGVRMEDEGTVKAPLFAAAKASFVEIGRISALTVVGIYNLFKQLVLKFQLTEEVSSPIGIYYAVNYFQSDFSGLLQLTALLSVAIGLFNAFPIPGLDGGHVLTVVVESITRKKLSNKTKNIIQYAGLGSIVLLFLAVVFNDLFKFGII